MPSFFLTFEFFFLICRNFHFNLKSSRIFGKRVISHILCAPKAKTLEMFQMFIQFISYKNFNILTVILIWKQSKLSFNKKGNYIKYFKNHRRMTYYCQYSFQYNTNALTLTVMIGLFLYAKSQSLWGRNMLTKWSVSF